jgi:hypothetical protein
MRYELTFRKYFYSKLEEVFCFLLRCYLIACQHQTSLQQISFEFCIGVCVCVRACARARACVCVLNGWTQKGGRRIMEKTA